MIHRFLCLAACLTLLDLVCAQEYEGAAKVLERLRSNEGETLDPISSLKKQIASFKAESRKLAPDVAGRKWLELFDAFVKIPKPNLYGQGYNDRLDLDSLIEALPPTPAWEPLAAEIEARQPVKDGGNVALKLLIQTLRGKPGNPPEILAGVRAALADNDVWLRGAESERESQLAKLSAALSRRFGKPVDEITAFRKELEVIEKNKDSYSYVAVPKVAGETADAEVLLTRVLKSGAVLYFSDEPTRKLAAKLVMANPEILRKPCWDLVASVADAPLYEKMRKRFPKDDEGEGPSRNQAAEYYLISLIVADKTREARKLMFSTIASQPRDSGDRVIPSIDSEDRETVRKTRLFLADLLATVPELPFWETYFDLSANLDATPEAISFLQASLEKTPGNAFFQRATEENLVASHLAADEIESAVEIIRARIKAGPRKVAEMGDPEKTAMRKRLEALGVDVTPELLRNLTKPREAANQVISKHIRLALNLTEIGRLSKKPEWVKEGLDAILAEADSSRDDSWRLFSDYGSVVIALVQNGRGADAEKMVAERLLQLRGGNRSSYEIPSTLTSLVYIYRQAGRWDDIVRMLDECDLWGTDDLSKLQSASFHSFPLQFMAAEALAKVGKKDVALQLIQRLLPWDSGDDAVYQFLLALAPPDLEMQLDKAYATNRFQERPLIWKAKVQLDAGRLDEAEKTIRSAIAIDPSDGEQGKGDRMRAYSVLAEVLGKKGDAEQAKVMRGAVEAIRISEDADDWWEAGLTTRAVKMYREALDHFADAYCIQSRLALRYSELGDSVNAEKHYQRAFELMPSSFGRVESHCFGCEGIFSGEKSQGVADRVFTRLAREMPDRAQVFYLLGYLRESQGRDREAIAEFRRAVALDPDYINAWKKIAELAGDDLSPKELDEASFALFRLGGDSDSLEKVMDLSGLWDAVLELEPTLPKPLSGPVYRLAASKADPHDSQSDSYGARHPESIRKQMTSNEIIKGVSPIVKLLLNQE